MNEQGQSSSVFRLVVFAIVVIALIALVTVIFPQSQSEPEKEISALIDFAKSIEGKAATKLMVLEKDKFFDAANFDDSTASVSFRCNGLECGEKLKASERTLYVQEKMQVQISARCELGPNLWGCKVYFGKKPAQVEVRGLSLPKEVDISSGEVNGIFEIENSGELPATSVQTTVKLFRKSFFDGQDTLNLFSEPFYDTEQEILPGESKGISFSFPVSEEGDFVIEVFSRGQEAGFDKKTVGFSATGAPVATECMATTTDEIVLEENECRQKMHCAGCNLALECLSAWETKLSSAGLEAGSKEFTLRVFEPTNGTCE